MLEPIKLDEHYSKPRGKFFKVLTVIAAVFYLALFISMFFNRPRPRYYVMVTNRFDFPVLVERISEIPPGRAAFALHKRMTGETNSVKVTTLNGELLGDFDCRIEGEYCWIELGP